MNQKTDNASGDFTGDDGEDATKSSSSAIVDGGSSSDNGAAARNSQLDVDSLGQSTIIGIFVGVIALTACIAFFVVRSRQNNDQYVVDDDDEIFNSVKSFGTDTTHHHHDHYDPPRMSFENHGDNVRASQGHNSSNMSSRTHPLRNHPTTSAANKHNHSRDDGNRLKNGYRGGNATSEGRSLDNGSFLSDTTALSSHRISMDDDLGSRSFVL